MRLSMESTMVSFGISQIRESKYYQTRIQWKVHVNSVKGCVTQLNIFVSECLLARAHQHIIAVNNAAYDWLFIFPVNIAHVVIIILLGWFFLCLIIVDPNLDCDIYSKIKECDRLHNIVKSPVLGQSYSSCEYPYLFLQINFSKWNEMINNE